MSKLREQLKYEEGVRLHAYRDSLGIKTIGVGWNMEAHPTFEGKRVLDTITLEQCDRMLDYQIQQHHSELCKRWSFYANLQPSARKDALLQMAFQLGVDGLMAFVNTRAKIEAGLYEAARQAGRKSRWYEQTPKRAERVLTQIVTNTYYPVK